MCSILEYTQSKFGTHTTTIPKRPEPADVGNFPSKQKNPPFGILTRIALTL